MLSTREQRDRAQALQAQIMARARMPRGARRGARGAVGAAAAAAAAAGVFDPFRSFSCRNVTIFKFGCRAS